MVLGPHLQQLNLLKCSSLSYQILSSVGQKCPNLRVLMLEMAGLDTPTAFSRNLFHLVQGCLCLESLCVKIRGMPLDAGFFSVELHLPKSMKILKLRPVLEQEAIHVIRGLRIDRNLTTSNTNISSCPVSYPLLLQSLSLVLDIISDELIMHIVNSVPFLVELELEDRPGKDPLLHHDLTNSGLQSLCFLARLTVLSLVRSRQNHPASFKRINDMGMFLLSEGCRGLESVKLGGFSKVSDAGFASILHSCQKLQKFEVGNAFFLSDLAFHDLTGAPCTLSEVRLSGCNLVTSETVKKLASSRRLEVLDFCGCRSIADPCLGSVSSLRKLTTVNLVGADITDGGLSILSHCTSPISCLSLRGCKRVTDKGIAHLLNGKGTMSSNLRALDLGYMPGISDKTVFIITKFALNIVELCLRHCFSVTDFSVEALAKKGSEGLGGRTIRRLDLFCAGLSVRSFIFLQKPSFRGLQWLGLGGTQLDGKGNAILSEIRKERPWLTICSDGCEMGCQDGWQYHQIEPV